MTPSRTARSFIGAGVAGTLALAAGVAVTTPPVAPGLPVAPELVEAGLPLARLAMDGAAVAATGLAVLPLLLATSRPKEADPVRHAARRAGVVIGALWVLATLWSLWLGAAELAAHGAGVDGALVIEYAARTSGGKALLVTGCGAVSFTILAAIGLRRPQATPAGVPLIAALFGLLPVPMTGHAADGPLRELTMLAISVHAAAVAAWLGGLGAVFALASSRRALLAAVLPRFSTLAGACLAAVTVSGLVLAAVRLTAVAHRTALSALVGTGYGWVLLAKLACLLVVATLGGHTRTRLLPTVLRHRRTATGVWVAAELSVLTVALGLAAALSRAAIG